MKKRYEFSIKVRENRVEDCFYSWYFNSEEQAKEMVEKIKKGMPLEEFDPDNIEDVEIIESNINMVFTDEMDVQEIVVEKEYPFVVTENGVVTEYVPSMRLSLILERLKGVYNGLDEDEKEFTGWDEVEDDLLIETFDRYGDRVVYQAIKN